MKKEKFKKNKSLEQCILEREMRRKRHSCWTHRDYKRKPRNNKFFTEEDFENE